MNAIKHDGATRAVMTAIAVQDIRMPYTDANDESPLVVVFLRDTLTDTLALVEQAGGRANVAVTGVKKFKLIEVGRSDRSVTPEALPLNPSMSMGMFLEKIKRHPKTAFTIRDENEYESDVSTEVTSAFSLT